MPLAHARGSGWFPVAVQALVRLAQSDSACSSSAMASDLNSHAVFLRRVLAQLGRANLIAAREGRDGGYRLGRPPDQITLADIYHAVNAAEPPAHAAVCGAARTSVESVLEEIEGEAEQRWLDVLSRVSLTDMLRRIGSADRTGN